MAPSYIESFEGGGGYPSRLRLYNIKPTLELRFYKLKPM